VVQLDCYNVPESEVRTFVDRFSAGALATPDYSKALRESPYITDISFELSVANAG